MKILIPFLAGVLVMGNLCGQTAGGVASPNAVAPASQPSGPIGIIILHSIAGYDAKAVAFVSIQWTDTNGGYVVDSAGTRTPFLDDAIGRIIYFDEAYYDEVNHNQYWTDWRAGLQNREVLLPPLPVIRLGPNDASRLQAEQAQLEDIIQRYSAGAPLIQPIIAALKDDCAKLSSGLVLQNGKWISAASATEVSDSGPTTVGDPNSVTFTTKSGRQFYNARIIVTATGVSVLTSDGGATLTFDQMPDDLKLFPREAREKIQAGQNRIKLAQTPTNPATPTGVSGTTDSSAPSGSSAATSSPPTPASAGSTASPSGIWATIESYASAIWDKIRNLFSGTTATPVAPISPATNTVTQPLPVAPPAPPPAPLPPKPAVAVPPVSTPPAPTPAPAPAPAAAVPGTLSANAVVIVKGDSAEGTGFFVRTVQGPAIITNLHVIAANPNFRFLTADGREVETTGMKGASDRDLAVFSIVDKGYTYLDLEPHVELNTAVNDPTIIPGNSEGGEVTLKTNGKVLGIGPQLVEFDNPIYHGNSGGPVFDVKTGKVIAVVVAATRMDPKNDVDKSSFSNANSAIKGPMRYFAYRIDTVPAWQEYDPNLFLSETIFLKNFHELSRALDSFMNGAGYGNASSSEEGPPDAHYYLNNAKVRRAAENYADTLKDHDKITAIDELVWEVGNLVNEDLPAVNDFHHFYPYDQERAKFEASYRQALKDEVERARTSVNNARSTSSQGDLGH